MNDARCFWGPTGFSMPSHSELAASSHSYVSPNRIPTTMVFCFVFQGWGRKGEKKYHSTTGFIYRRWTEAHSPFLSDFLRWANTPFSFYSRVWIYTPKFKWYLKKEISIFFSFYYHFSMFEERFSIRTSRAPNARNHRTLFFIFF